MLAAQVVAGRVSKVGCGKLAGGSADKASLLPKQTALLQAPAHGAVGLPASMEYEGDMAKEL